MLKTEGASLQNRKVSRRNRYPSIAVRAAAATQLPVFLCTPLSSFRYQQQWSCTDCVPKWTPKWFLLTSFPLLPHLGRFKITMTYNCSCALPACLPVTGLPLPLRTGTCAPRSLPVWKVRQYCATKRAWRSLLVGQAHHRSPSSPWMAWCCVAPYWEHIKEAQPRTRGPALHVAAVAVAQLGITDTGREESFFYPQTRVSLKMPGIHKKRF